MPTEKECFSFHSVRRRKILFFIGEVCIWKQTDSIDVENMHRSHQNVAPVANKYLDHKRFIKDQETHRQNVNKKISIWKYFLSLPIRFWFQLKTAQGLVDLSPPSPRSHCNERLRQKAVGCRFCADFQFTFLETIRRFENMKIKWSIMKTIDFDVEWSPMALSSIRTTISLFTGSTKRISFSMFALFF